MSKVLEQGPDDEGDEEERGIKPARGKLETMHSLINCIFKKYIFREDKNGPKLVKLISKEKANS